MIGQLIGILSAKNPPEIILDVNGVGYEVNASMHTFYQLPDIGNKIKLYTHFIVREDAQLLFGFFDKEERSLFRTLIKVNGVGPKLALTILSSISPIEFAHHVLDNNSAALVKLPGVGKKTAERLIIEMRDKLSQPSAEEHQVHLTPMVSIKLPEQEAVSALVSLGYKPQEASKAISRIDVTNLSIEEIIRQALKRMV